ncbi:MAG: asparagine synthase, partial [Phaeodactylibacter sp.]|nr:asparagine synthase [Phaeodactylibacter sp.]
NPALSENQWARKMVEQVQAQWIKVQPRTGEFSTDLEDFIYSQDTPTLSSGTYLQYRLFKAAAERGIPLLFDGQAADGLFGGHQFHYYAYWKDLRRLGQWQELRQDWKRFGGFTAALKYSVSNSLKYNYLSRMPFGVKTRFYEYYYQELNYLNRDFWQSYKSRLQEPAPAKTNSLNQMLYQGFYKGTMPFLLKCVDRASNYFGVESAMPFAEDRKLYEYVHSIPGIYKIHAGHRKWLLKEAYRQQLPPAIYNRSDKMALLSPNNQWLRELRPVLRPYFEALDGQIIDKHRLLKDFDAFFNPKSDLENYRIYKFAAFALWRHVFGL